MRLYVVAAVIGLAGVGMIAGAAVVAHHSSSPPAAGSGQPGLSDQGGEVWGRSYFPNIPLTTQDGETVHFFDDLIKDKVVTISFMYTSCPDICPVETARLLQVARLLGDRLGKDVFFYSITIDPEHDTQQVLKAYTDSWNIPSGWTFLTGKKRDIVHLRKRLGMRLDDVRSGDLEDHTVNLLIGNQKTGLWMKRAPFENPYYLASQLGGWLHGFKLPPKKKQDYGDAPELRQISDGEYVFRTHCSSCHTIGGGDVLNAADRHIGPDLFNVTEQRDREWLERWLAEPDQMLEEKDPLAMALYEKYNKLPMPNLHISETDITKLLGYMAQESQHIRDMRSGRMAGHMHHPMAGETEPAANSPEKARSEGDEGHEDLTEPAEPARGSERGSER